MDITAFYKVSGIFIIMVALGFTISQIGITKIFNYPQILRENTDIILKKFHAGGTKLKFFWTCFALSSLMLAPMSAVFYKIFNRNDTPYLLAGTAFGIASGIFYVIGLMRWTFLADNLSKKYVDKGTDAETKKIIEITFQAFHVYCGNSIGETMGFLCMGIWIMITGTAAFNSAMFPSIIGAAFIICGFFIFLGPLEWLGFKAANKINKIGMKLLMVLLIYVGIKLIIF